VSLEKELELIVQKAKKKQSLVLASCYPLSYLLVTTSFVVFGQQMSDCYEAKVVEAAQMATFPF
jgi:hypothetical protein